MKKNIRNRLVPAIADVRRGKHMKQRSLWEKGITWLLVVIMIATIANPGIRNKVLTSAEDTTPPVISEILLVFKSIVLFV